MLLRVGTEANLVNEIEVGDIVRRKLDGSLYRVTEKRAKTITVKSMDTDEEVRVTLTDVVFVSRPSASSIFDEPEKAAKKADTLRGIKQALALAKEAREQVEEAGKEPPWMADQPEDDRPGVKIEVGDEVYSVRLGSQATVVKDLGDGLCMLEMETKLSGKSAHVTARWAELDLVRKKDTITALRLVPEKRNEPPILPKLDYSTSTPHPNCPHCGAKNAVSGVTGGKLFCTQPKCGLEVQPGAALEDAFKRLRSAGTFDDDVVVEVARRSAVAAMRIAYEQLCFLHPQEDHSDVLTPMNNWLAKHDA